MPPFHSGPSVPSRRSRLNFDVKSQTMTEAQQSIRESLLTTLSFLASVEEQREFASKVFYSSYQDEFAGWWFDNFLPDESGATEMFTPWQLVVLREFSHMFDTCLESLCAVVMDMDLLLQSSEWQALVAKAKETSLKVTNAI